MRRTGNRSRRAAVRRLTALSALSAGVALATLPAGGFTPPVEWEEPAPRTPVPAATPRERAAPKPAPSSIPKPAPKPVSVSSDRSVSAALVEAALAIREPGHTLDPESLSGLSAADLRLVEAFHEACRRIGRDLEDGKPAGEALLALDPVLALASEGPPLVIPRVEICSRVESHGKYAALSTRSFPAGKVTPVLLYTELLGFTTGQVAGRWRTEVASRAILLSKEDGSVAWSREWLPLRDESDRPREEFFLSERIDLPATLAPGRYVLKSTVRDEATGRIAERSIPIEIAAPERTAAVPGRPEAAGD